LNEYFGTATDQDAHIIIKTTKLESKGFIENGMGYLPLTVVQNYLNERYYLDEDYNRILYATPSELTSMPITEESPNAVVKRNDTIYLSLDYVKQYTNMETYILEGPSRIVIQNTFSDMDAVKTNEMVNIRYQGGIKSDILTVVPADTELMFLEELENWCKVATFDGYTGYVEKKKLSAVYSYEKDTGFKTEEYTYHTQENPVVLAWHQMQYAEENANLDSLIQNAPGLNVISPTWYFLADNNGNLTDLSSSDYVAAAHEKGIQVWGLVENITGPGMIYDILSHTDTRTNLINQLVQSALNCGMDGINIDFESLSENVGVHFTEFLREMSIECHKNNLILSVDDPVPANYNAFYNRSEQGKVVDYVIIMGYDEHYQGGDEIGSVASLPWVEQGIKDTLDEVPAERVINAMPFYSRLWKTQNGTIIESSALGMKSATETVTTNNAEKYWDKTVSQNAATYEADGFKYSIWIEDAESIAYKAKLAKQYKLAGVAAWKLGLETADTWTAITDNIK
ncbi:MAG: glycosyl hydrolase family 18 protein, partial [Eubacteriales bacterium]|nr:glycosyl hydrolase family 18 protein [Eubacteriales bacterium]